MLLNCGVGENSWESLGARRSNQSILKEVSPDYSLEGLMLKLQYFGHLMRRANSLEKTLMLGKIEGKKRRGWQRMRWLDGITDLWTWVWANSRSWWCTGRPGVLRFMGSQRVRHDWATEQQQVIYLRVYFIQNWGKKTKMSSIYHCNSISSHSNMERKNKACLLERKN